MTPVNDYDAGMRLLDLDDDILERTLHRAARGEGPTAVADLVCVCTRFRKLVRALSRTHATTANAADSEPLALRDCLAVRSVQLSGTLTALPWLASVRDGIPGM